MTAESPNGIVHLERVGLGFRADFPKAGVLVNLERVRESRGDVQGELIVQRRSNANADGHLFAGRFNVSSLNARASTAKYLASRMPGNWVPLLEGFCVSVLQEARRGADFETIGQRPSGARQANLVDPIMPLGKPTVLFGIGGALKTTLGGGLAVSTKTGRVVIPGWTPTPGDVLVLDWEDDAQVWNDQLRAIANGIGVPPPTVHYRQMARPLADDVETIARFVSEQCVLLVIVDSVGLAIGATQDGQTWTDGAFRLFTALREIDVTSLLIDHVAGAELGAKQPVPKPYGSVYKVNLARSVFEVRPEPKRPGGRTEVMLVHTKVNASAKLPPQGIAVIHEDGAIRFERTDVEAPELIQTLSVPDRMERLLRRGALSTDVIAHTLGISQDAVRSYLSRSKVRFLRLDDGRIGLVGVPPGDPA